MLLQESAGSPRQRFGILWELPDQLSPQCEAINNEYCPCSSIASVWFGPVTLLGPPSGRV
jgi:hypothetical protein